MGGRFSLFARFFFNGRKRCLMVFGHWSLVVGLRSLVLDRSSFVSGRKSRSLVDGR